MNADKPIDIGMLALKASETKECAHVEANQVENPPEEIIEPRNSQNSQKSENDSESDDN